MFRVPAQKAQTSYCVLLTEQEIGGRVGRPKMLHAEKHLEDDAGE